MGFWKQFLDAFEKEGRLNSPVDKWEWERHDRELRERDRRREERERRRELEFQRKHVELYLPKRLKRFEHNREKLKAVALKLTGKNLDNYAGVYFDDDLYASLTKQSRSWSTVRRSSGGGGCGYTPSIQRDYDQEDAEAHEGYINSVCSAIRVGRILRMVNEAR